MFPIILERDTKIIEWGTELADWSTNEKNPGNASIDMTSDGLLHAAHGTMSIYDAITAVTQLKCRGAGLNMTGPEAGNDYTAYQISVVAHAPDAVLIPLLFVGESIATITNNAAGDAITDVRVIAWADVSGTQGSKLEKDFTIVVKPNTADRGLAIGVAMYAPNTTSGTLQCHCYLSVRRMIGISPPIIDTRKL